MLCGVLTLNIPVSVRRTRYYRVARYCWVTVGLRTLTGCTRETG
jgi:hypothetical protein